MTLVARTTQLHFQNSHPQLNQPDLITFHVEFLARPSPRPATIHIHELKMGRQFSLVRVQLVQQTSKHEPRICLEALVTQGNLAREIQAGGPSLPTRPILPFNAVSYPPPRSDFEEWHTEPIWRTTRPVAFKLVTFLPKGSDSLAGNPSLGPSVREQWVRWSDGIGGGDGFTIASLPFLADSFRPIPEAYGMINTAFPTLSYGLEVKRAPPTPRGWEWLFLRIEMRQAKFGRYDMDVVIFNEEGELVALGKHTSLIIPVGRHSKEVEHKIEAKL